MLPRWLPLLLLLAGLTGCATRPLVWDHRSGTNDLDTFNRDKYICVQESRTQATGVYIGRNAALYQALDQIAAQQQSTQLFVLCMQARGWVGRSVQQ